MSLLVGVVHLLILICIGMSPSHVQALTWNDVKNPDAFKCATILLKLGIIFAGMILHQIGSCFLKVEVLATLLRLVIGGNKC